MLLCVFPRAGYHNSHDDLMAERCRANAVAQFNEGLIEPEDPAGITRYLQNGDPVKLSLTEAGLVEIKRLDRHNLL